MTPTTTPVGALERAMRTASKIIAAKSADLTLDELTARVLELHPNVSRRAFTSAVILAHGPKTQAERRARQVYEAAIARASR